MKINGLFLKSVLSISLIFSTLVGMTQTTTIGFWKKEITLMNTYLLIGDLVPEQSLMNSLYWDASKIVAQGNQKIEEILQSDQNLFVLPITEEIDKGVRNHKFILARGKAGIALPKHKDEHGFYMGGAGVQVLASVYVDPAKMKSNFACLYLSALNSLIKDGSLHASQDKLTEWLKENYWYEGMTKVHFESSDLMSPLSDTTTLVSIMPHALVHSHASYTQDMGPAGREDCFADIIEVKTKGGKSSYQAYFFSFASGLVYHDILPSEDRKSAVFTKKEIHKYGTAQKIGKK